LGIGLGWRYLCYAAQWNNRDLQVFTSLGAFDSVAFGVLLNLAMSRWSASLSKRKGWAVFYCLSGVVIFMGVYLGTSLNDSWDRVYASTFLSLGLFLFLLGGLQFQFWNSNLWEPLSWPGRYCFGGYLLHPMVLAVLFPILFGQEAWKGFFIFAFMTMVVATISFHLFEKPANRLIRKTFHSP
jgi:peptidoglycan/LPS O-acetylase OafA/YrhL